MAKTLQQILGAKNLCGVIQGIKQGIPSEMIPPAFFKTTRTVEGDHCTYRKVEGTRKTARQAHYGSPSRRRQLTGVKEVPVKLIHSVEHERHQPATLMNLQNMANESKQNLGIAEITRQTRDFKQLFSNLRTAAVMSMLATGYIYFDGDGNLLPSSSGAKISIDVGIPAGNRNQLDVFGTGAIIGASWGTAGTAINQDIKEIKRASLQLTGYSIKHCFYGENILNYFLGNTKLKEIINRNAGLQGAFANNEIADGFLGLNWHPADEAFYEDADGSIQEWWSADTCVFTPDPSPEWYEVIEGTYPVPTNVGGVARDAAATMNAVTTVAGMFSYAIVESDPVSVKQVAGDTFLPLVKVPKAVFIADVTP